MTQILQDLVQQKVSGAYRYIIRELKQWWWWCQREGLKSNRFRLAKQQLCTCITYNSLPSLHDYDMELFNFTFCGTYAPCKRTQHGWPTTPNLVGCYMLHPFAHPVACRWMLLHVVVQSLKPVKLFSRQLPTFLLFHDPNARSLRMDYKDLWVVFFLQCTAGPKLVGSCCIRLHTTTNTHATTPNIVGATVLGVVVPICMAAINTSPWNEHFVLLFSRNQLDSDEIIKISIDIAVISRNHAVKMRMRCFKPMMDSNSLEFLMN